MNRIPLHIRIFSAILISFFAVKMLPTFLVSSPIIPTKVQLAQLFTLPHITLPSIQFGLLSRSVTPTHTPIPSQDTSLIPSEAPITPPTGTPTQPLVWPTITPKITLYVPPDIVIPTAIVFPTAIQSATPTQMPPVRPTIWPTTRPTEKPAPTTMPSTKVPNYSKLNAFVANMPVIGCKNNTIVGCPVDSLYNTLLDKGLGWATYYGDEHKTGYNIVAEVIHNRKGISVDAALKFIDDNYMQKQSDMTPEEARKTGKVIAYAATRTPQDLWKIKYVFGIDDPKNPQARFIGRIMIIDCAASNDWRTNLSTLSYSYKGWSRLNWIVDLSKNGFIQIPTGLSGRQDNVGEGRPGVILIDEASLDDLIY